jgi:hypothetical protein
MLCVIARTIVMFAVNMHLADVLNEQQKVICSKYFIRSWIIIVVGFLKLYIYLFKKVQNFPTLPVLFLHGYGSI